MSSPRVLFAHEFDPAGVHIGYRDALRASGVEAYATAKLGFVHRVDFDRDCPKPDVLVVAPGVGDGTGDWASGTQAKAPDGRDTWTILPPWVESMIAKVPKAKKVALIHGSPNLWALGSKYVEHWRARGFALAATTIDYAVEMGVAYLPPSVERASKLANLRADDEPLAIVQTPSVPEICHTYEFIHACFCAGALPVLSKGQPHFNTLWLKTRFHAGFDHLRGAFSVNTLENCAIGLASIFGIREHYLPTLRGYGIVPPSTAIHLPPGPVENLTFKLEEKLRELVNSPKLTRRAQEECHSWYLKHFRPEMIAQRLLAFFEEVP